MRGWTLDINVAHSIDNRSVKFTGLLGLGFSLEPQVQDPDTGGATNFYVRSSQN